MSNVVEVDVVRVRVESKQRPDDSRVLLEATVAHGPGPPHRLACHSLSSFVVAGLEEGVREVGHQLEADRACRRQERERTLTEVDSGR